jgi:hypothetical protein
MWTRLVFVATLALAGCASVTKEECETGDWVAIGTRDGAAGRVADTQFARHVQACGRAGITPDRTTWEQGYRAGLVRYCTPLSGLREGEAGRPYRGVCPPDTEAGFENGHSLGLRAYRARSEITRLEADLANSRSRVANALTKGDSTAAALAQADAQRDSFDLGFARATLRQIEREIAAFRTAQAQR